MFALHVHRLSTANAYNQPYWNAFFVEMYMNNVLNIKYFEVKQKAQALLLGSSTGEALTQPLSKHLHTLHYERLIGDLNIVTKTS